jgi:hypothetical protein
MKLKLPTPIISHNSFLIRNLVISYIAIYKNTFISKDNVRIETFDSWDFYRISLFKDTIKQGRGTLDYRNREWEKTKESIDIFDIKSGSIRPTWKWITWDISLYDEVEGRKDGYVPGIEFWVYKL